MLELLKIQNGLVKVPNTEGNPFLDTERYFTKTQFEDGLSYFKLGDNGVLIELDENVLLFVVNETTIDGVLYSNQDEFINSIFGNG
jgi:hypothetical protein